MPWAYSWMMMPGHARRAANAEAGGPGRWQSRARQSGGGTTWFTATTPAPRRGRTVVQVAIEVRVLGGPDVHAHARALAVRRGSKVGVVVAGAVLGVGLDGVAAEAAVAKVVLLEVARHLVEAVLVEDVVDDVVPVEQVGDRSVNVLLRVLREVDRVVEGQRGAAVRAVVVLPAAAAAGPVLLGPDVVADGGGERVAVALVVPAEGRGLAGGRVHDDRARAVIGVVDADRVDVVRGVVDPVVDGLDRRALGVDIAVEPVVGGVGVDVPHQAEGAVAALDVLERRLDLGGGKVALGQDRRAAILCGDTRAHKLRPSNAHWA